MSLNLKRVFLFIFILWTGMAWDVQASGPGSEREKLRGLKEVGVFVELVKPPAGSQGLSRNQIQNDIETKLRQAGIKVVTHTTISKLPALPFFYLDLTIKKMEAMYIYNADIICFIPSQQPNRKSNSVTWNLGTAGFVSEVIQVREKVADMVNLFIKDYISVNPDATMRRTSGIKNFLTTSFFSKVQNHKKSFYRLVP